MIDPPQIAETAVQPTAVIRLTIPRAGIREVMGPGITELMGALAAQGIAPAGPWFNHHFRMEPGIFDFEIGIPVTRALAETGRVTNGGLPAVKVARAIYRGPYEGLPGAWGELERWIAAHGHHAGPSLWEVYAVGPESGLPPTDWQTVLHRPLVEA